MAVILFQAPDTPALGGVADLAERPVPQANVEIMLEPMSTPRPARSPDQAETGRRNGRLSALAGPAARPSGTETRAEALADAEELPDVELLALKESAAQASAICLDSPRSWKAGELAKAE